MAKELPVMDEDDKPPKGGVLMLGVLVLAFIILTAVTLWMMKDILSLR